MIDQKALEAAVEAMRDCHAPDACAAVAVAITAYEAVKPPLDKEALEIVLVAAESFITIIEDYPQEADAVAKYKAAIAKLRGIEG
jgi:hypothetical protein